MKHNTGILVYRVVNRRVEVLLIKIDKPYKWVKYARKWSIPKGEIEPEESPKDAAIREFKEKTGLEIDPEEVNYLTLIEQSEMKDVEVFVVKKDLDLSGFNPNMREIEWPKGSGKVSTYPEAAKIGYFNYKDAKRMMYNGQVQLLNYLDLYMQGDKSR